MVRGRLRLRQHQLGRVGIGYVRVGRDGVALDARVAVVVGIAGVEKAVRRVVRVESYAQQTALAPGPHASRDVQERRPQQLPVFDDADPAALLHHEQARVAGRRREIERAAQTPRHDLDR